MTKESWTGGLSRFSVHNVQSLASNIVYRSFSLTWPNPWQLLLCRHICVQICKQIDCVLRKKMVLCLIVGCGSRSGRDKGLCFGKVPWKSLKIKAKKPENYQRKGDRAGFRRLAGTTSRMPFWRTIECVRNTGTSSLEKPQNRGINSTLTGDLILAGRGFTIHESVMFQNNL